MPSPLSIPNGSDIIPVSKSLAQLSDDELSSAHTVTRAALAAEPDPKRMQTLFAGLVAIRREISRRLNRDGVNLIQ